MVIVCLGEALIDLVPPAGKSPGTADNLTVQAGGAPLNVAIGLARLGCGSLFLGCLSSDPFGRRLSGVLDHERVTRVPGTFVPAPTRLAVIDHSNREAPFTFYGDTPADSRLTSVDVVSALDHPGVSGLYVSSLMMTNESGREVQQYAIESAQKRNLPVYTDPNPRPAAWSSHEEMVDATVYLYERSSLAKLSIDDARALGWPDEPGAVFDWWARHFSGDLFLTGGAAGCWMNIGGQLTHVQPPGIEAVDPTGAGDAAFAGLIGQIHASTKNSRSTLRFAAASGALATLRHGAISALPTTAEVDAFVARWS